MNIAELLVTPARLDHAGSVEMDALTEADALVEAALLEVSVNAASGDAWLLFDCRGALQIRNGNTAIVVVREVSEFRWRAASLGGWTWHAVMSWNPSPHSSGLAITAGFVPNAEFKIVGCGAEFYVGNVPGGDAPPPDFTKASQDDIRHGLANWSSEFKVVGASYPS